MAARCQPQRPPCRRRRRRATPPHLRAAASRSRTVARHRRPSRRAHRPITPSCKPAAVPQGSWRPRPARVPLDERIHCHRAPLPRATSRTISTSRSPPRDPCARSAPRQGPHRMVSRGGGGQHLRRPRLRPPDAVRARRVRARRGRAGRVRAGQRGPPLPPPTRRLPRVAPPCKERGRTLRGRTLRGCTASTSPEARRRAAAPATRRRWPRWLLRSSVVGGARAGAGAGAARQLRARVETGRRLALRVRAQTRQGATPVAGAGDARSCSRAIAMRTTRPAARQAATRRQAAPMLPAATRRPAAVSCSCRASSARSWSPRSSSTATSGGASCLEGDAATPRRRRRPPAPPPPPALPASALTLRGCRASFVRYPSPSRG